MPIYRPIPGQTDRQPVMPMNSPPMDDLTMMARERASNILMPYAQTGIPTSPTSPGPPGVNPTPGVTTPTATASGVEDKLYQAVHPDTFSRVLEIIMQFVTGKPIPRQGGGPVEPEKEYTVGEEGPERFKPAIPGEIIPYGSSPTRGITYGGMIEPPSYSPFDPFRQRNEMAEAASLRKLAGVTYNPNRGPLTQPGGLGGALERAGWTGTTPGSITPTETRPPDFAVSHAHTVGEEGPERFKPAIPGEIIPYGSSPTRGITYGGMIEPPSAGGFVALPYTGPRPWQNRPPDFAVSHAPGEYPIAKAGGWQDYGEGIGYKLGEIGTPVAGPGRIPSPEEQELAARRRWETPGYAEAHPNLIPGYQKSYYEAHPEERAAQEFYDIARGPQPGSYEYASEYMRNPMAARKAAREREALATKGAIDIYGKSLEHGIGTPSSQERLAHAQYYREQPGAYLAGIRETNIARLQGIRDQVAGHLEVAKVGAGAKDQILRGLETFLQKGSERVGITGLPFDLQKEAAGYMTVMKDLGYIAQEQYDKLPDIYKEKQWTEQSLRADLKKNGMKDKDIEAYVKRAKATGRI